ncbi:oxidative stress defense protein [Parasalinivibrio latis]|uniref:oxidative stress defense protein n=1 Tax=Parasalinivibrio latis TaxID=2952610 RepID=UPI0030E57918
MKKTLIAALFTAGMVTVPAAMAATPDFPHLETMGVGQVTVQPDMANLNVEVVVTKDSAQAAKKASDKAISAFISRLKKEGVADEDIQSANLNLQPQYRYENGKAPELTGYRASRQVTVTVNKLADLNSILDSALDKGLNRVNNIQLKSSKEAELAKQARIAAIKDAQVKAAELAKGFGQKLDGVWEIRYMDSMPVRPVALRMAMDESAVNKSYQYGQITLQDQVEVVYKIK